MTMPPRHMLRHERSHGALRGGVEGGGRLIEQPDWPADNEQARQRGAAALAGREHAAGRSSRRTRSSRSAADATVDPEPPSSAGASPRFSRTVRAALSPSRWPTKWLSCGRPMSSPAPSTRIAPSSGRTKPARALSNVVLPTPLGPSPASPRPAPAGSRARQTGGVRRGCRQGRKRRFAGGYSTDGQAFRARSPTRLFGIVL